MRGMERESARVLLSYLATGGMWQQCAIRRSLPAGVAFLCAGHTRSSGAAVCVVLFWVVVCQWKDNTSQLLECLPLVESYLEALCIGMVVVWN